MKHKAFRWMLAALLAAALLGLTAAGLVLLPVVMPLLGIGTADGAAMAALSAYTDRSSAKTLLESDPPQE